MNPTRRSSTDPDAALRAILEEPVAPMEAVQAEQLRERVTRRIAEQQARELGRSSFWRQPRAALLIAAASVLLVASVSIASLRWMRHLAPPGVELTAVAGEADIARNGVEQTLLPSARVALQADEEIRTGANAHARAMMVTGAVIDIGPAARLRFMPASDRRHGHLHDRVELAAGKIDVSVPKLSDGDEVSVDAEEVSVVVHGTKFSVEHWAAEGGKAGGTRVAVSEGKVSVYTGGQERLLTAGTQWTLPTPPPAPSDDTATSLSQASAPPLGVESTLATENALLGSAMQERRLGHYDRALSLLYGLIAKYPRSPLVETARLELLRIFGETGESGRLRLEAERYLKDYPNGTARPEVRRMIDTAKTPRP
jgi:hypothetical protein